MIAALIQQDAEAFALHAEVVRTGAALKAVQAKPGDNTEELWPALDAFRAARAALHEKCELEAA